MPLLDRDEIEYELERIPSKVQIVYLYIRSRYGECPVTEWE